MSRLDHLYRRLLLTKFFVKGWGQPENLKRLFEFRKIISDRQKCRHMVPPDYPIYIDKDTIQKECRIIEGHFQSPFVKYLPGIMPKEVETAHFQMILPKTWKTQLKPVCVQLAGTGDHFYWRRRALLARPLLKESGIASIILENPYYGLRKPKHQLRSSLHNVSDLFVMGGALVLESLALFHWCEREGYGPLGITGISMGGFMASLAATNWHKPLALVPCLSWSTASSVFTQGVMSGAIPWKLLQNQYLSDGIYEREIAKLIVSPEDMKKNKAFQMGRDFARRYPESVQTMEQFQDMYCDKSDQQEITIQQQKIRTAAMLDPDSSESQADFGGSAAQTISTPSTGQARTAAQYHTSSKNRSNSNKGSENKSNSNFGKDTGIQSQNYSTIDNLKNLLKLDKALTLLTLNGSIRLQDDKKIQKEALLFMRGVMDECTHLGNFTCPVDPSLIIIVAAKRDAYVPRDSVLSLQDMWPESELRYINSGHISAFLFNQDVFRKAISDTFDRQIEKYYS